MNVPSQTLLNLHDLDYGEWQGVSHEAALQKWPRLYKTWKERPHLMRFPGDESLQDLVLGTADGLRLLLAGTLRNPTRYFSCPMIA